MTASGGSLKGNAYLTMAVEAIRRERRPLSPSEILSVARDNGFLPSHLFGATMHKTLSARLAENIRAERNASQFFRTAPAKFFLHDLADRPETPNEYRNAYVGHLRSKSIRKENVLVADKDHLSKYIHGPFVEFDENLFNHVFSNLCNFMDRSKAEEDNSVKQFVTFTLVVHRNKILTYRRGKFTTTSERLKGQLSVGFGGHVNDLDFGLFSQGKDAFRFNAARELGEELFLDDLYRAHSEAMERTDILGFVNVDDSPDAEHHIAVLTIFNYGSDILPKKGELSINQLNWLDLKHPIDDIGEYDLWSGIILENILNGGIKL